MDSDQVEVFLYTFWDEDAKAHKTSTVYATVEAIRKGLGVPLGSSGKRVDRTQLTDGEMYVPPKPEEGLVGDTGIEPVAPPV